MAQIPVVCDSCGEFFTVPSPFGDVAGATFIGNTAGPCPQCGGMGHVPDGVYNLVGSTIELLRATPRSANELHRIAARLAALRAEGADLGSIRRVMEEELPEVRTLGDLAPRTRQDWYMLGTILLALLALLARTGDRTTINVQQVINHIAITQDAPAEVGRQIGEPAEPASPQGKVGRNEPCPCGSGRKYKKCHGVGP